MSIFHTGPLPMVEQNLSRRLDALAELVRIGRTRPGKPGAAQPDARAEDVTGFGEALLACPATTR